MFARTPFNTLYYEIAADQGHFVDEYTVIHEMAVHLGIVIMLFFILGLTSIVSFQWTFILAAFASLASRGFSRFKAGKMEAPLQEARILVLSVLMWPPRG